MSVLPIRIYGDPALRREARHAPLDDRTRRLAADMIDTMYYAYGRGLAAPQVGESLRLFVMDCHWKARRLRLTYTFSPVRLFIYQKMFEASFKLSLLPR